MKRNEPCAHLRPDYSRMEVSHYIERDPETGEISWEPSAIEESLKQLGLIHEHKPRRHREPEDPDT